MTVTYELSYKVSNQSWRICGDLCFEAKDSWKREKTLFDTEIGYSLYCGLSRKAVCNILNIFVPAINPMDNGTKVKMFPEQLEAFALSKSGNFDLVFSAATFGLHIVLRTWTHPFQGHAQFIWPHFSCGGSKIHFKKANSLLFLLANFSVALNESNNVGCRE